ncbi:TPA: head-tail connector protein [Photobacterium damselae]
MSDFISLEEAKLQCNIEPLDTIDDKLLHIYIRAALAHVETYTNRKLVTDPDADDAPENALRFSDDIKTAALLLISNFYENREEQSDVKISALPFGFKVLVGPYKFIPV